jgi:SnoaL-like domain
VIFVDGDTATERAYWVAFTNQTPQHDVQVLYFGHYESELRRVDGHWLYSHRKIYNESLQNREAFYPALGEHDPRPGAGE